MKVIKLYDIELISSRHAWRTASVSEMDIGGLFLKKLNNTLTYDI